MFGAEEGAAEILVEAKDHLLQGLADDNRELKYSAFYHLLEDLYLKYTLPHFVLTLYSIF